MAITCDLKGIMYETLERWPSVDEVALLLRDGKRRGQRRKRDGKRRGQRRKMSKTEMESA